MFLIYLIDVLQTHLVCVVPPYRRTDITESVTVRLAIMSSGKTSEPHNFTYTPAIQQPGTILFARSTVLWADSLSCTINGQSGRQLGYFFFFLVILHDLSFVCPASSSSAFSIIHGCPQYFLVFLYLYFLMFIVRFLYKIFVHYIKTLFINSCCMATSFGCIQPFSSLWVVGHHSKMLWYWSIVSVVHNTSIP